MNDKMLNFAMTLAAKLDPAFKRTFAFAGKSVDNISRTLEQAENAKRTYDRVMAQQRATLDAAQNFAKLKERLQTVSAQMRQGGGASSAMSAEYNKLQAAVKRASAALSNEQATLARLKADCGVAGQSLAQLKERNDALTASAERAASAQRFAQMQGNVQNMRMNAGMQFGVGFGQLAMIKSAASSLASPIKLGMEFDQTMSKVGAVSQASAEDLAKLREQARELGASTVWSASQAAEGMTYLAMAGFKTDDMLKAMPGMLSLASAGAVDLGSAADIASNMLTGFNLKADEIGRVGDVMVNTFTNSNTSLSSLGETMKYVAPVASSLGVSIEETAAMAAKLGDAGIQGSMAGTGLRAVMNRLAASTPKGTELIKRLGVSVKDASGEMRPMADILGDLGKGLSKFSGKDKAKILSDIFGVEAMSAATVLIDQATNGSLKDFTTMVSKSGAASRVASEQTNNLTGDLANLNSAWEELYLILSDTVSPALRQVTQWMTGVITTVGDFAKKHETLTKVLAGAVGAVGAVAGSMAIFNMVVGGAGYAIMSVVGGFLKMWQFIMMVKNALVALKGAMLVVNAVMIANPIGLIITAIGLLVAAIAGVIIYWDELKAGAAACWSWFENKFPNVASGLITAFGAVKTAFVNIWAGIESLFNSVVGYVSSFVDSIGAVFNKVAPLVMPVISALTGAWSAGFGSMVASLGKVLDSIKNVLSNIIGFIGNVFTGNWTNAWQNVVNIFGAVFTGITALIKAPLNGVISAINSVFEKIGGIHISVPDWVPGLGGKEFGFKLPQIPALASGGVATSPTMALIGEGPEPEAVLPLSKLESLIGEINTTPATNLIRESTETKKGLPLSKLESAISSITPSSVNEGDVNITFSPVINVNGGTGDAYEQVSRALSEGVANFESQMRQYFGQRRRLSNG